MSLRIMPLLRLVASLVLCWILLSLAGRLHWLLPMLLTLITLLNVVTIWLIQLQHPWLETLSKQTWGARYLKLICRMTGKPFPPNSKPSTLLLRSAGDFTQAAQRANQIVRGHQPIVERLFSRIHEHQLLQQSRLAGNSIGPLASFLLVGQEGIGKRYLMRVVAKLLYGAKGIDVFHCEKLTTEFIQGSRSQAGELFEILRDDPLRLLFFEEVHKTPQEVLPLLVQFVKTGKLSSSQQNESISLNQTLVVFSSTVAVDQLARLDQQSQAESVYQQKMLELLTDSTLDSGLLHAVTELYFLQPPSDQVKAEVVTLLMKQRCREHDIELRHVDPEIVAAQVLQMEQDSGFQFVPERIKKLLHKPLLAAIPEQPESLSLRVNAADVSPPLTV
ncbi:MAG: AAA family ATPase [Planctomycetaceae bacterium]|nr:AAA family ATPase [Planctomycetaceae bacterium]